MKISVDKMKGMIYPSYAERLHNKHKEIIWVPRGKIDESLAIRNEISN